MGQTGLNKAQNEVFRHFLKFGSYNSLVIAYDDSLRQSLTSSRGKTHIKNFGGPNMGQTGQNRYFLKFDSLVFLDIIQDCRLGQCPTSSRPEISKINYVAQIRA